MTLLSGRRGTRRAAGAVLFVAGTLAGTSSLQAQPATGTELSSTFQQALSAYDQAWASAGLSFTTAVFAENGGAAYGQYTPRADAAFSEGETLSIYAEPVGYGFRKSGPDYSFELTANYKLLNQSGQVLVEQENFAAFSGSGRSKQRELAASLTFQFSGLPAGDYQLETLFTDKVNGNQADFTLPFTISAPD